MEVQKGKKRIAIDLDTETIEALTEFAASTGNKLKPFIEYLLRLQVGTVNPKKVEPIEIPEQETAKERIEEAIRRLQQAMNEL